MSINIKNNMAKLENNYIFVGAALAIVFIVIMLVIFSKDNKWNGPSRNRDMFTVGTECTAKHIYDSGIVPASCSSKYTVVVNTLDPKTYTLQNIATKAKQQLLSTTTAITI